MEGESPTLIPLYSRKQLLAKYLIYLICEKSKLTKLFAVEVVSGNSWTCFLLLKNLVFWTKHLLYIEKTWKNQVFYSDVFHWSKYQIYKNLFCGFYLFISLTLTKHCAAGEEKGYCCSSYPALPPTSYVIRHKLKDYCRELVFAYS